MLETRTRESVKDEKHLLDTGELLDNRYRLLRRIGGGGYGEVYAVEHVQLKKKFALKVLSRQLSERSKMIDRFRHEAMATSKIDHPNIVSLTDFGRLATGQVYYVMELLEGFTLAELLDQEKVLGLSRAIPILAATCHALAASHRAGIVHRDLKPANIFIADTEDIQRGDRRDFVKILDFGFAKVVQEHPDNTCLSTEGVAFGTPGYMAPEQLQGKEITSRVDIYAIGCIAFEMFAGRQVFTGSPMAVAMAHCEKSAPLVRQRNPEARIPERMELLIDRCLRKDPRERFQSCLEVLDELRDLTRVMLSPEGRTLVGAYGGGDDEIDGWKIDTDKQQWWEDMSITLQRPRGLIDTADEIVIPASGLGGNMLLDDGEAESDEVTVRQDPDEFLARVAPPGGPLGARVEGATIPKLRLDAIEKLMRPPAADSAADLDFSAAAAPATPARKVLLVERDPAAADAIRADLRGHGWKVEWLADGENTLQIVEQEAPDLIILSVELDRISGYAICSRLKQSPALKGIPLILISKDATQEHFDKHRALTTRAEAYLIKPFTGEQLLAKVDALTGIVSGPKDQTLEVPEVRRAKGNGAERVRGAATYRPSSPTEDLLLDREQEEPAARRMDRYLIVGLSLATVMVLGLTLYFLFKSDGGGSHGAMLLQVRPAGATLQLDGKQSAETGETRILGELKPGDRLLKVSHPGCKTATQTVKVRAGSVSVAKFKLVCD